MKKNLLLIATLLFAYSSQAQFKFAPMLGLNFSGAKYKVENSTFDTKAGVGFNVGGIAEIGLGKMFSFMPGIVFNMRNFKHTGTFGSIPWEFSYKLSYVNIPLNFMYKTSLGGGKLFAGIGPDLGIGVGGKVNSSYTVGGKKYEMDTAVFGLGDKDGLKSFDIGLNINAGYRLAGGFMVGLQYTQGLANLGKESDVTWKNSMFSINFMYFLNNDED